MTFGQRVRELRRAKGLTQRELAREAGISFTYVSKLETGSMPPPRHKIIMALASVLGVSDKETDELARRSALSDPEDEAAALCYSSKRSNSQDGRSGLLAEQAALQVLAGEEIIQAL